MTHSGKVAIVTGAGSGIGQATVLRLAREGARVVGCDVNPQGLAATRAKLEEAQLSATLLVADVARQEDVERVVAEAGRVDILANVAGIMDFFLPLDELDDATWQRVLSVNLDGVMRMTRAVLPRMREAGGGAIVTVASKASFSGGVSGAAYAASKHGVIGLVRHVAYFYGPLGIRSNAVLPGPVETGIGATAMPKSPWALERAKLAMATMPKSARPEEIAAIISWIASDEASFLNGALVTADGGWSAA
ncbi:SDR family NAD(P)-dependent oxidoreductase [Geochorda subterranea]|uniref:SDR family oxidoreductase n=1 Tax=Geochorda subterranea TaxID=3109564 RepID=A0ABZ1BMQ8_9FIRM|nr:SDR family oxidoreductase [Limnochorda sp. LNt]WRP13783.1 SDR family oxidoreductase [Limnochorda sp. LNt]